MPPATRTATRLPRTAAGTGAGSIGIAGALRLKVTRALGPNDLEHVPGGGVGVLVHDHVVVILRVGHLPLRLLLAPRHLLRVLRTALQPAPDQLLHGRRLEEDEDPLRPLEADRLGAMDLDLEDHVVARALELLDPGPAGAVIVAVGLQPGPLQQLSAADQLLELGLADKAVVDAVLLVVAACPGGEGDRVSDLGVEPAQLVDHRVLADAARSRDHQQQPGARHRTESRKVAKSAGGGASKPISAPVRGWTRRSRQACSIGRGAARPPP